MFSVLGFDGFKALSCMPLPRAGDSPEGLFKMQKEITLTHVFDGELWILKYMYNDTMYNFTSIFWLLAIVKV